MAGGGTRTLSSLSLSLPHIIVDEDPAALPETEKIIMSRFLFYYLVLKHLKGLGSDGVSSTF